MKKPDMECARKMAEKLAVTFVAPAFVYTAVADAIDEWRKADLIDDTEERPCPNCDRTDEWKALCINPKCKNYAR